MNGGLIDYQAAVVGFAVAFLLAVLLTPVVSQAAWLAGVVDASRDERRLHDRPTPLLGGLAILGAIVIPSVALGHNHGFWGIVAGATLMSALGALDDIRPLHPGAKMLGIILIAAIPASLGVTIDHVTLPLVGAFNLGFWQYPLTIAWIVAIANIVNFIDGLDGLAAGFCAIASLTFAILSASLGRVDAAAISAIVAGAAFGFLIFNFNPATIFMGDSGSLMLGYLLAALSIQGVLKTAAAVSLVFPLVILALPILDTSFVILKRLKYRQPIYQADRWHFHHRFANIGFSQRRTAIYLYGWCCSLSALALAIRFVPNHRHDWSPLAIAVLGGLGLLAILTSLYVIYLLEILKARHLRAIGRRRTKGGDDVPQSERAA
ncbi:MAG: UDP-GlcNAc:undecaprenyl-phosphate/decaprenyl-phosphate GlcNAc-phosphate transferase [Gaiellales bacterium]|nr:UDP-GlcNAc:undecaprenyl-phosphate/decaprenyl-phosphate GlcNAc-phosphate transferase [Gaiellales bacterium]